MESYLGPQYPEKISKDREIQNGNNRDSKDLFQTGDLVTSIDFKDAYFQIPIQNQSRICLRFHAHGQSYQFRALQFGLSTAPMESTVMVKVKLITKGYKNPPVPRRLVGQSQIPPNLTPAYTDSSTYLSGVRLVGEHAEIITRPETSLQLCRLPVEP